MPGSYEYTPYLWPVLASAALSTMLLIQGIRCRSAPGAMPFVILAAGIIAWVSANGMTMMSTDDTTRFFWFKFQAALMLPLVTVGLCFAIEYAGLGRFLTRRMLAWLAIGPLVCATFILTDHRNHLMWARIWFDGYVRTHAAVAGWGAMAYAYFLSLLHLLVLLWLFVRSPRHRGIAVALIITTLSMRCGSFLRIMDWNPAARFDPLVVVVTFALLPYAFAVFCFRMFDVVSVARNTIIERMADAMIVLDAEGRIVDLNGAAERILDVVRSKVIGRRVADAAPSCPDWLAQTEVSEETRREISLADGRCYQVSISPLVDERGFRLGRLVLLHEITEIKRAQAQLLDHQRTVAMLNERELLARELHDGIGQVLAAAHLQADSARELLARGDTGSVESCLSRLSEATQKAKESIREYLLGVKARSCPEQGLLAVLRRYVEDYSDNYGIRAELIAPDELEGRRIDSVVEAQLQPIIQEALLNARRRGGARSVRVVFALCDGQLQVTIQDDGCGFNPDEVSARSFGLRSMRGRAEAAGGSFEVESKPSEGTRVSIRVPWRREPA
ncbi:MAG TPA: histidine kinase N-terminal 7TM domain-containing protein [Sedimentisphaerales bacterium]|nr:histidine kinase N-terminal 7TM domain-containing protein [Sedimentisphaerales bacterium]HNU31607.1 histidine kinase N-terminal 7TM domain-containing protein [Sedimentisphaerales bacterium]